MRALAIMFGFLHMSVGMQECCNRRRTHSHTQTCTRWSAPAKAQQMQMAFQSNVFERFVFALASWYAQVTHELFVMCIISERSYVFSRAFIRSCGTHALAHSFARGEFSWIDIVRQALWARPGTALPLALRGVRRRVCLRGVWRRHR